MTVIATAMVRVRIALGICLLLVWYLVALDFIAALGALTVLLVRIRNIAPGSGTVRVAIASGALTLVTVFHVVRASLRPQPARGSVKVDRDEAPAFWQMLDELADASGLDTPTELRLVPDAEIWTVEQVAMLGLLAGPRVLYVGLPLVFDLEPRLLQAAICHELGHHRSGHLRFGAVTYRASDAIDGVLRGVRKPMSSEGRYAKLMARPLAVFAFFYQRITLKARRAHEYEADKTAATVAGSAVTADALRTAYALERAWRDYKSRVLKPALARRTGPDDPYASSPYASFTELLATSEFRAELEAYRRGPLPSVTTRRDSHPSLADRVKRIEQQNAPGTLASQIDATAYRDQIKATAATTAIATELVTALRATR